MYFVYFDDDGRWVHDQVSDLQPQFCGVTWQFISSEPCSPNLRSVHCAVIFSLQCFVPRAH